MRHRSKFCHKRAQEIHAKRQSPKILFIIFCRVRTKVADLAVGIGKYNPDITIGTEKHFDSSVNSSDLFPSNYYVIRKHRHLDKSEGGGLIAMTMI